MNIKLVAMFACLSLAVPTLGAMAADRATLAPWSIGTSQKVAQSSTNQCDPPCVAPEECCKLSELESACVLPKDCCREQQKLKKK